MKIIMDQTKYKLIGQLTLVAKKWNNVTDVAFALSGIGALPGTSMSRSISSMPMSIRGLGVVVEDDAMTLF